MSSRSGCLRIVGVCVVGALLGCADDNDGGQPDGGDADADADTDADTDTDTDTDTVENFGFALREPANHTVSCSGTSESMEQMDVDWICTFDYDGVQGYVYFQNTPTDCQVIMGALPIFATEGAFLSVNGVVTELDNATYDRGGNHNNDFQEFDYGGRHLQYYHSSFGFGWRVCQPMDCIQVYASQGGTLVEDGCTADRTLPIVCLAVTAGETYEPADFADTFEKCLGDPNA